MNSQLLYMTLAFALSPATAAQTVTSFAPSTNTTPDVWYENDVRLAGTASILDLTGAGGDLQANQPLPIGAARITTTLGDTGDKAEVGVFFDGTALFGTPDDTFSTLSASYSYFKASNAGQNASAAPALKLTFFNPVCDDPGSAGDCFGTLVYEPTWNQPGFEGSSVAVPTDTWTSVTITETSGLFWWTGGFGEPNTAGGPPLRTLADWKTTFTSDFGDSLVAQISIGVGTFNLGQIGYFDDVELSHAFGGGFSRSWDFEPLPPTVKNLNTAETFDSIQEAIDDADTLDGHILEMLVSDHTTPETQIVFNKDLTLQGAGFETLRPSSDTTTSGDARGWFLVELGRTVTFRKLTFDGTGNKIHTCIRNHGALTVTDCDFTEIKFNESGPTYAGLGISHFGSGGAPMTVSDCTFSEMGRIGIHIFEPATIERCTYTGKGPGNWLDYFSCVDSSGASLADATFDDCTISGNRGVAAVDGSASAGLLITTFFGLGTKAIVTNSSITDNTIGIAVGFNAAEASDVSINESIIAGNAFGLVNTSSIVMVDALDNWWGDASGPDDPGGTFEADNAPCFSASFTPATDVINADGSGDSVTDGNVDYCPWLCSSPQPPATLFHYNGSGINLDTLTATSVIPGTTWTAVIAPQFTRGPGSWIVLLRSSAAAGAIIDLGLLFSLPPAGLSELLVGPGFLFDMSGPPHGGGGTTAAFNAAVPMNCGLLGAPWFVQAVVFGDLPAGGGLLDPQLSSAAGGVIGSF